MTPEHIVIQMTDGTEFAALVHVESGKLHVSAGGFLGLTFVIDPESAKQVCEKILIMLGAKVITITQEQILDSIGE